LTWFEGAAMAIEARPRAETIDDREGIAEARKGECGKRQRVKRKQIHGYYINQLLEG
jgi:hypothetical protein